MTQASEDMRGRVEQVGRDIESMKAQSAQENLPPAAVRELEDIETRHEELHRRLAGFEATGKPEHRIAGALAADLDGLVQAVSRWIARQDLKAARR